MEKHKDAYNQFSALLKKEVKGRWLLGQLLAQYKMGEFNDSKGQQDIIDKYLITQTRMDFKRELLMFQMYLAKKDNNKRFFEQSMRDYVGGPTQFAINYRVDPLVWMPGYDFKVFDTLYQFIIGKQKGFDLDKLGITFLATYALENQRYEEVQLFIKSSSLESSNPDKLNIHFQYLMLQGRKMEAMAVIKSSGVENLTSFSQFLVYKTLTENREFRSSYGDFFRRSGEIIEQEKNFFTLYAKFTELRAGATPEDKNKLRAFLDDNLSSVTDFTPFLLAKGELN